MKPIRSRLDWTLEAVALLALLAAAGLIILNWDIIPAGVPRPRRLAAAPTWWTVRNALWVVMTVNTGAYAALTIAGHFEKLICLPGELLRQAPHLRRAVFSVAIILKAVLMLFGAFLVWTLVHIAAGRPMPVHPGLLTLFVLVLPVPLVLYTLRLRRAGR